MLDHWELPSLCQPNLFISKSSEQVRACLVSKSSLTFFLSNEAQEDSLFLLKLFPSEELMWACIIPKGHIFIQWWNKIHNMTFMVNYQNRTRNLALKIKEILLLLSNLYKSCTEQKCCTLFKNGVMIIILKKERQNYHSSFTDLETVVGNQLAKCFSPEYILFPILWWCLSQVYTHLWAGVIWPSNGWADKLKWGSVSVPLENKDKEQFVRYRISYKLDI